MLVPSLSFIEVIPAPGMLAIDGEYAYNPVKYAEVFVRSGKLRRGLR